MTERTIAAIVLLLLAAACGASGEPPGDGVTSAPPPTVSWAELREGMVDTIRENGIEDEKVLAVMGEVERHRFVPKAFQRRSYENKALPIGEGQTISQPFIVGLMTGLLELTGEEKVLEIGTGSGYQAAVLSRLVPKVYTIEIRETLAASARACLAEQGYDNVDVICGDGYEGMPDHAPFDAIIVTAAPPEVPQALVDQLAIGGRMVVPVGPRGGNQRLILIRKMPDGEVKRETSAWVYFVPMISND